MGKLPFFGETLYKKSKTFQYQLQNQCLLGKLSRIGNTYDCINVYQGNIMILTISSVHKFLQLIVSNIAPSFPEGKVPFKADGAHFCSKVLKTQKKQTKVVVRQFSLIQAQKNGEKRRKNGVACLTSTSLHAVSK